MRLRVTVSDCECAIVCKQTVCENSKQIRQKAYKIDPKIEKSGLGRVLGGLGWDFQAKDVLCPVWLCAGTPRMTSGWRKLAPKVAKMGGKIDQDGAVLAIWKPFSSYVGYLRGGLGVIFTKTAEVWI